jgi:hypothetical protein
MHELANPTKLRFGRPAKPRHVKKTILALARLLKRAPVLNTPRAIELLLRIAKNKKRKMMVRNAASTIARFLEEEPRAGRKVIRRLCQLNETKPLSVATAVRVFAAPVAFTTLKRHLKDFANKTISFEVLIQHIENWYERRVPQKVISQVMNCGRGKFYDEILRVAMQYGSPKSLITNATIKRMHLLKFPQEEIKKANDLKWKIHGTAHEMYAAAEKGNKEVAKAAMRKMRALQSEFIREFTKKL